MVENFAKFTGLIMMTAALVVTILLLTTIFQVLYQPESVAAVKIIGDFLSAQFPLFISDIREKRDVLDVDPSSRLLIVYFVASIALVALGSVLHALVSGAISFLKFARRSEQ
ncbi:hypothetical protein [Psychromonas aquimarina]|uniref:hypothetical protein n=1 Tax=Psychromonas aquimarina TaxID=444919 RepID=UPI00048B46B4|nr:hypothetical protein [Psychromonas aquimarina]